LSGKYAQAALNQTSKLGGEAPKHFLSEISNFRDHYVKSSQLQDVLENPFIAASRKRDVISEIFKSLGYSTSSSSCSMEVLNALASTNKLTTLKEIILDYQKLLSHKFNEIHATVTSAQPLSRDQVSRIESALKGKVSAGATLVLKQQVDPVILGGLVVSMDGKSLDLSVVNQIRKIDAAIRHA